MLTCGMCGAQAAKLAKSHIYPRSMTREAAGDGPMVAVPMKPEQGRRPSYANGGFFDRIVCRACEQRFGPADEYAIKFRRDVLHLRRVAVPQHNTLRFLRFSASPELLHTFAMQCWYRAFLSHHPDYDQAVDPELAQEVQTALMAGRSTLGSGREVAYLFERGDFATIMAPPMYAGLPNFQAHILGMPNMTIWIAAGPAGLPPGFKQIALHPGGHATVYRGRRSRGGAFDPLDAVIRHYDSLERLFGPDDQ